MKTYARIVNGVMVECIGPMEDADGNEIPIEQRFHPDFVALLTEIDPQNPPPTSAPAPPAPDWRPEAVAALYVMRKSSMDTLTAMQMDYSALGQQDNAAACLAVKQALKEIENTTPVRAVYDDPQGTRAQYKAAVKAQWDAIVAPAPLAVKADFIKYGGNAS